MNTTGWKALFVLALDHTEMTRRHKQTGLGNEWFPIPCQSIHEGVSATDKLAWPWYSATWASSVYSLVTVPTWWGLDPRMWALRTEEWIAVNRKGTLLYTVNKHTHNTWGSTMLVWRSWQWLHLANKRCEISVLPSLFLKGTVLFGNPRHHRMYLLAFCSYPFPLLLFTLVKVCIQCMHLVIFDTQCPQLQKAPLRVPFMPKSWREHSVKSTLVSRHYFSSTPTC